ncbi:MAG: FxsA family protein [Betaproteobacteria bacterium]|nr:FxsA family protein [Betaproteobacteria bacterium]
MRYILLAILIGFPLAEAALLVTVGEGHALWVIAWLVMAAIIGVALIKEARFALISRLASSLAQGRFSLSALIDSGRTVLAGLLLIFPGLMSDVMALVLLLLPVRSREIELRSAYAPHFTPRSGVIEGEYRHER